MEKLLVSVDHADRKMEQNNRIFFTVAIRYHPDFVLLTSPFRVLIFHFSSISIQNLLDEFYFVSLFRFFNQRILVQRRSRTVDEIFNLKKLRAKLNRNRKIYTTLNLKTYRYRYS